MRLLRGTPGSKWRGGGCVDLTQNSKEKEEVRPACRLPCCRARSVSCGPTTRSARRRCTCQYPEQEGRKLNSTEWKSAASRQLLRAVASSAYLRSRRVQVRVVSEARLALMREEDGVPAGRYSRLIGYTTTITQTNQDSGHRAGLGCSREIQVLGQFVDDLEHEALVLDDVARAVRGDDLPGRVLQQR